MKKIREEQSCNLMEAQRIRNGLNIVSFFARVKYLAKLILWEFDLSSLRFDHKSAHLRPKFPCQKVVFAKYLTFGTG
jgi:hypothetical protein